MVGSSQWLLISMVQSISFPPIVGFSQWLLISKVQLRSFLLLLNDGSLALSKWSAFQHFPKLVVVNQTGQNSRPLHFAVNQMSPKILWLFFNQEIQIILVDFSTPVPMLTSKLWIKCRPPQVSYTKRRLLNWYQRFTRMEYQVFFVPRMWTSSSLVAGPWTVPKIIVPQYLFFFFL